MFVEDCVFCRIVQGREPASMVYHDERLIAFRDIHPAAPTHILIVPTRHIGSLNEVGAGDQALLGEMLGAAHALAVQENIDRRGYRLVMNTGIEAGQSVPHLHVHLLGGRPMRWPPG